MSLPDPETVLSDAAGRAESSEASTPNVLVAGAPGDGDVAVDGDRYVGAAAGDRGRLAAATAVEGCTLHYPDPDFTARGPWLVLEPLAGRVATVARGTGRVTVTLADAGDGSEPLAAGDRVVDVLEAAVPTHEVYPVTEDDEGVFTTGLTTFTLSGVDCGDATVVRLDAAVTPATTTRGVVERFGDRPHVADVAFEVCVGVERADPSPRLRDAVERAHEAVVGDWEYEWLPSPTAFSRVPGGEKVALGAGRRDAGEFTVEEYDDCRALLRRTVAALDGEGTA